MNIKVTTTLTHMTSEHIQRKFNPLFVSSFRILTRSLLFIETLSSLLKITYLLPFISPSRDIPLMEHVKIQLICDDHDISNNNSKIYVLEPHHLEAASIHIDIHLTSNDES
jgi:hypothetical protein